MKIKVLFLLASLGLAGCASPPAPLGHENVTPHLEGEFFVARDGVRLPISQWSTKDAPRAVIIGLHGMSDYANAFAIPAKLWAERGITTIAYDQRGFGRGPLPGSWAGEAIMQNDLYDFAVAVRARFPGIPVYALGESMGGAVLLTALAKNPPPVDGAILSAPAVWSRGDMPLSYRVALFLAAHFAPGMVLSNNAASRVVRIVPSDNIPMLIALGKDPWFQKRTGAYALFGLVNLMDEARVAPEALSSPPPILMLTGEQDQLIPKPPTQAVIAALGSKAEQKHYQKGYHMLLRDLEGAMVAKDVADWILSKGTATKP